MAKAGVFINVVGDERSAVRSLTKVRRELDQLERKAKTSGGGIGAALAGASAKFSSAGSTMRSAGTRMSLGLTLPLVAAGAATFKLASDLNEAMSKTDTIFGKAAGPIHKWAEGAAEDFGQSQTQAENAVGTFGNLFTQLGIGAGQAGKMSMGMTELASDFASFHNADITEVIEAQSAAFRGEFDALQRFVPTINAASVAQKAMAMTGKTSTDQLTEQDKALATHALMMEGAGAAIGDFDRTSEGAANQQRILTARFQDAAATIGQKLMPIGLQLAEWVTTLLDKFEGLSPTLQTVILVIAGLAAAAGPVVAVLGAVATAIGFILSPVGLVIAAIAAVAIGLYLAYQRFEGFRNIVDTVARAVRDFVADAAPKVVAFFKDEVIPAAKAFVDWAETNLFPLFKAWFDLAKVWLDKVIAYVQFWVAIVRALWDRFGEQILERIRIVWEFIRGAIEAALQIIRGIIMVVTGLISGDWAKVWDGIKLVLGGVWNGIVAIVQFAIGMVRNTISIGLNALAAIWGFIWGAISAVIGFVWGGIVAAIQGYINLVWSIISGALGLISSVWSSVWNGIAGAIGWVWETIKSTVSRGVDAVVGFVTGLPGRLGDVGGAIGRAIIDGFKGAWNAAAGAVNDIIPNDVKIGWGPASYTIDLPDNPVPTFHRGGVIRGFGEMPIMALAGERILSRRDAQLLESLAGPLPSSGSIAGDLVRNLASGAGRSTQRHYHLSVAGSPVMVDEDRLVELLRRMELLDA